MRYVVMTMVILLRADDDDIANDEWLQAMALQVTTAL